MKKLKIALSEALKETANKENAQPRATFRSVSSNARTTNVNYSATAEQLHKTQLLKKEL